MMKYLRGINESDEPLYKNIGNIDYNKYTENVEPFSKSEIDSIESYIKKTKDRYNLRLYSGLAISAQTAEVSKHQICISYSISKHNGRNSTYALNNSLVNIIKGEDNWFYIHEEGVLYRNYYRCDDLVGVIGCMNEIIMKRIKSNQPGFERDSVKMSKKLPLREQVENRIAKECSEKEYYEKMTMHGFSLFEEKEISYISDFINSNGYYYYTGTKMVEYITLQKRLSTDQSYRDLKVIITKLNDKWYTIENRKSWGSQDFSKFYICDEFTEVKNYLESVKND